MFKKIIAAYERYTAARDLHRIAAYWHKQGAILPYAEAVHEQWYRQHLGEFRRFASARYLEDPSLTMTQIADEWIDLRLKMMMTVTDMRQDGKALIGAVRAMRSEMFFGEAAKAYRKECDKACADARRAVA